MDPGAANVAHRTDGAAEFALQGAHQVHVLYEAGGAEALVLVEQFVTDRAAARQALLGECHAQAQDVVTRHEPLRAVAPELLRDPAALEPPPPLPATRRPPHGRPHPLPAPPPPPPPPH